MTIYQEHFDSGKPAWLTEVTSGTPTIAYTDSEMGHTVGANEAAFVHYNEQAIATNENLLVVMCFRHASTAADYFSLFLVDSSGEPTPDTLANFSPDMRISLDWQQDRFVFKYFTGSHDDQYWDEDTQTFTTGFNYSHENAVEGDYYVVGFEVDGDNAQFRFLSAHQNFNNGFHQGIRWHNVSSWVAFSSLETVSNELRLCFGWPYTDQSDRGVAYYDWMLFCIGETRDYFVLNADYEYSAFPEDYRIKIVHTYNKNSADVLFVPSDINNTLIDVGAASDPDEVWASRPCVVVEESGNHTMFYDGRDSGGDVTICRATAGTDPTGTWTKYGSNPVVGGASDDFKFPFVIIDLEETDSNKKYKLWVGDEPNQNIDYYTSSNGISWTLQGTCVTVGAGGAWDDVYVSQPTIVRANGEWQMWYAGFDGTVWKTGVVIPDTDTLDTTSWTKYGSNPVFNDSDVNTTLSADTSGNGRTWTLTSTTGFSAEDMVVARWAGMDNLRHVISQVRSISGSDAIMYFGADMASGDAVHLMTSKSEAITALYSWVDGNGDTNWTAIITVFRFTDLYLETVYSKHCVADDPKSATWSNRTLPGPYFLERFEDDVNVAWSSENLREIRDPYVSTEAQGSLIGGKLIGGGIHMQGRLVR